MLPVEIDVSGVKSLLDSSENCLLIDVRTDNEREVAKIDAAVHIPMTEVVERIDELESYRDQRVIVHCHFGGRSLQVTQWLRANGFENAQNLSGGIDAWSQEIDDSIARY